MTTYKLHYFNLKGLGEPIRLILSYMGKEFEDHRQEFDNWPEVKKSTPFGKLPTLEIGGKVVCQSTAICRYLAVEAGLSGKNDWENLQIDMVTAALMDFHGDVVKFFREPDTKKKEELRQQMINETIPFYFQRYEERVKKDGYLATSSLTWGDIFFVSYTECVDGLIGIKCLDNYPCLKALKEKIYNIPNIKKWIQKRPDTR